MSGSGRYRGDQRLDNPEFRLRGRRSTMRAMLGETVGTYRLTSPIGHGGMGVVYEAEHTLIGRRAAVKLLLPETTHSTEHVERFFNEARAASRISHPGL